MNTKMKTLVMAVVGLVGFGAAGAAMAQCPASLTPPWSAVTTSTGGVVASVSGGLDTSACKMSSSLGNSFSSQASVTDNTPANETRYRYQFLVNADATGAFGNQDSVSVFSANSAATFPASGGTRQIIKVAITAAGAGAKRLTIIAACNNGTNNRCIANSPTLVAGTNRFEMDVTVGAAGTVRYWLNAAAGTAEPATTGTITITGGSAGWVGVDQAVLGQSGPSPTYKTNHTGQAVFFDTFDSRRQTYIGY